MIIDEAIGSQINPLSNTHLENETLTGEYLRGIQYAPQFMELINGLSKLPIIELMEDKEFYNDVMLLKKELVSKTTDLLERDEVIKIYNGNSKLIPVLKSLESQINVLEPILTSEAHQRAMEKANEKVNAFNNATLDHLYTLIDLHDQPEQDFYTPFINVVQEFKIRIAGVNELIDSIKDRYYDDKVKVPKSEKDFKLYILDQLNELQNSTFPSEMLFTLIPALTMLENSIPNNELDPMKIDEFYNLVDLFRRPDRFYHEVKTNKIICPEVTEKFAQVFSETYHQAVLLITDRVEKLPYNQQIIQLDNCALPSDNQELVTLCTQQYQKGA